MIGGLVTSFLLELLVYPAVYKLWKQRTEGRFAGGSQAIYACSSSVESSPR
jgi:hypothetical protein